MGSRSLHLPNATSTLPQRLQPEARQRQDHEVAVQGGAPLREEEGRWGEDQEEISRQSSSHCREVTKGQNWRFGQKEVPGSLRSHSWAVLLPHKEENQPEAGGRPSSSSSTTSSPPPPPPWARCTRSTMRRTSSCTLPTPMSRSMATSRCSSDFYVSVNFWLNFAPYQSMCGLDSREG